MWEKWYRKLKNLFGEENVQQERQEEKEDKPSKVGYSNLRAKTMYQYPEKRSFRFPVIPDEKIQKENDGPQKKPESPYSAQMKEKEINKVESRPNREKMAENSKIYKRDPDVPFEPTEVPSPVYGYQTPRKEKELESIPAFERKREILQHSTEGTEEEVTVHTDRSPLHAEVQEIDQKNEIHALLRLPDKNEEQEEEEQSISLEAGEQQVDETLDIDDRKEQKVYAVEKTESQSDAAPASSSKPVEEEKEAAEQPKNPTPFNVIMTPRDKKRQFDRQRKMEQERKNAEEKYRRQQQSQKKTLPYHLLDDPVRKSNEDAKWVEQQQELLEQTLTHFNVKAKVVNATQGPSVTRFEVQPELGVKVSKVKNLSDDLKLNMSARDIRIEAPIPGKNTIGIEIPNLKAEKVGLQEVFDTEPFQRSTSPLTIALGVSIEGTPLITNIQKMPHGLIAGATGSGKSVCINTILVSMLYKAHHDDVKFMLIDPKMVELAPYNGIPHLVSPVITDVKAATAALKWAVNEMEDRYEKFVEEGVRDIERYNQKVSSQNRIHDKMPFLVIVIDELADLMMVSPQDVEDSISRIAQKARACGIHLLLATQRPSVDVITGLIKANIPTRIAFSVSSQVDSRTILDTSGAEKLLGKGDMLFIENGTGKSIRLQGPFVSDDEIERVTNYARSIAEPEYMFEQEQLLEQAVMDEEEDELLEEAVQFVLHQNSASTSLLQRHFKIGYNRAARLIDSLENRGIISGQNGSKPREVLVSSSQIEEKS
ncbi:DNA translocase FtsK [Virgibacillus sediminis]|uniref:DNA translocase FtsK n=1 Tax=Virgibacillus sediminis TaxID=202260 RepID=A0ABV7A6H1_9BACI